LKKLASLKLASLLKIISLLLCLVLAGSIQAIGFFSMGGTIGLHPNPNNIMYGHPSDAGGANIAKSADSIAKTQFYNKLILTADGKGEQFSYPMAIPFGLNLKYNWNHLLLRIGLNHSLLIGGSSGSITPSGGKKNVIDFHSSLTIVPVTFGFVFEINQSDHFYFGMGPMFGQAVIVVQHSKPKEIKKVLPADKQDLAFSKYDYKGVGLGFHYVFGMEVPLSKRFSLSVEWLGTIGSTGISNAKVTKTKGGKSTKEPMGQTIDYSGQRLLFGFNYFIGI